MKTIVLTLAALAFLAAPAAAKRGKSCWDNGAGIISCSN